MLKAVLPRLRCACCDGRPLAVHAFRHTDSRVLDGVLTCGSCGAVFTIDDGLLELVPPALVDRDAFARFAARFAPELAAAEVQWPAGVPAMDVKAQLRQRQHFDWFAENTTQTYSAYQASPFWVAEDALTFEAWRLRIAPGSWLLDVGCANGRSAWPLLSRVGVVVGCDISAKLVRQAIARAAAEGVSERACFFVADGDHLPIADGSFPYALTYGVLHHLPNPARACREIQRVLEPGGVHFGSENNLTVFRRIFDLMMCWRPLWIEEAGAEPLISEQMLRGWLGDLPVRLACTTSVFIPPHLMNAAGHGAARWILSISDRIGRAIPGLRGHGGLIVFDAQKMAT
jgi:SAM-dependent methyltransferase